MPSVYPCLDCILFCYSSSWLNWNSITKSSSSVSKLFLVLFSRYDGKGNLVSFLCAKKSKSIQYNRILGGIMPKAILSVLCYYHQCHFIQQKQQQHLPASDRTKTPTAQRHHLFRIPFVIPAALAFYCCTIPSYYFYIHVMCCYLLKNIPPDTLWVFGFRVCQNRKFEFELFCVRLQNSWGVS